MPRFELIAVFALTWSTLACTHRSTGPGPRPGARTATNTAACGPEAGVVASHTTRDPEPFVLAGSDFVRKARAKSEPDLYRNAQACVSEALARQPQHPGALRLQGLIMLNEHRFAEARDLSLRMLAGDQDDALSWGTLSDAQLELGDLVGAIESAQRMMDLKPNLPAYGRAAHLRWLQGDRVGAKRLYELAIAAGSGQRDREPRAWMIAEAARIFWHEGDYRGADAGFDLALREVADYAPALEGKGRVALALGDYSGAIRWLERSLRNGASVETAWRLGDAHSLSGNEAAAGTFYERVVRDGERHDPRTLALFYASHDREPERALRLARAEHTQRQDIYSKEALAFALYRNGDVTEADRIASQALAHGTPDARLLYHAGLIKRAAGQDTAGSALISAALRLNPRFDPVLTGGQHATALAHNR